MADPIVNQIYAIRYTAEPGVYVVSCNLTDMNAQTFDADYCLRPDDPYGCAPALRQWMADNPSFPIEAYVPPTIAEVRASASGLNRLDFRQKMKAAGVTTATIMGFLAGIADPDHQEDMQMFWEDSQQFARLDPFVVELGEFAGKTPEQLDPIWGISNA